MVNLRYILVLMLACLMACSGGSKSAGGGGVETGNGIRVSILTTSAMPATQAHVALVRTDNWLKQISESGSPTLIALQNSGQGKFSLDSIPPGTWAIQAQWQNQALWSDLSELSPNAILQLDSMRLVYLELQGDSVQEIHVVGTGWNTHKDSLGQIQLYLPHGTYSLVSKSNSNLSMIAHSVTVESNPVLIQSEITNHQIIIDDFSQGTVSTALSQYTGISHWYLSNDINSRVYSSTDSTGPSYVNGMLSFNYIQATDTSWVVMGIAFTKDSAYYNMDLSPLDSICMEIRGDGYTGFYLQHVELDQRISVGIAQILLDSNWTRHCYTPVDFGPSWDSIASLTNDMTFVPKNGSFFEIRSLSLWGIPLQDLFH